MEHNSTSDRLSIEEKKYGMYCEELSRAAMELSRHCLICKPILIVVTKDGISNRSCDYCKYKKAMHKHMEQYSEELRKE